MTHDLHVHVHRDGDKYVAWADETFEKPVTIEEGKDQGQKGASPDEALGALIRDCWIGGYLDGPVQLEFDFQTE